MQVELLNRQGWNTWVELANAIFEYIEGFRNRRRRRSDLGWQTPLDFEKTHTGEAHIALCTARRNGLTRASPARSRPSAVRDRTVVT